MERQGRAAARRDGGMMRPFDEQDQRAVTALRVLAIDQVEQARSGHPGLPLGAAPMVFVLFSRFLRYDPQDPSWPDRDRFVLSAGHGSALLYAALHLFGYPLSLEELRRFRQLGSKTPGHPEHGLTPGVECTTGPLGQGLAMAVGMALAERHLASRFNQLQCPIINHRTYVLASDGDLMEGISHEAASLAGHLQLGKLVVLYDDNRMTIEGPTSLAFSEDVEARFRAYGWLTLAVEDGNDLTAIAQALLQATSQEERPVLIRVRTHIGFGAPTKQDSAEVHGAPLGAEEHRATRANLGWPHPELFFVPDQLRAHFHTAAQDRAQAHRHWQALWQQYQREHPALAEELTRRWKGELPVGWDRLELSFSPDKPMATREASGRVLNALAGRIPELLGGSADLAPSNNTLLQGEEDVRPHAYSGRNLRFGVREHAMAAMANGLALHGGVRPYVATFLVFSDYLRPALRLSALQQLPVVYVFTHDSIGLGEDGPTHQPVEHLPALRAIPNVRVFRPADAHEVLACWQKALAHRQGPTALILSRQKMPVLSPPPAGGVGAGAYVRAEASGGVPQVVLWASGSEVHLALATKKLLEDQGIPTRVVSAPCLELFRQQPEAYQRAVRGPSWALSVAIEAARGQGWKDFLGQEALLVSMEGFGASGPGEELFGHFGFTPEAVANRVWAALQRDKPTPVAAPGFQSPDQTQELLLHLQREALPRLVARDAALWGPQHRAAVAQRLGWLDLPARSRKELGGLSRLVQGWAEAGIQTLVLLGMGGSSLAPQVLREMLGNPAGRELVVLDTTDPVRTKTALEGLQPTTTAVLAISKSGTTVETNSLLEILWQWWAEKLPQPGAHFAAITEPGTPLEATARQRNFAALVVHPVDVGGRFSALSAVGLLPALWLGLDGEALLAQGERGLQVEPNHPAVELAAQLAACARDGWARLLLWPDQPWRPFALWLEQLLAESTGKEGKGVLPVVPPSPQGLEELPACLHLGLGHVSLPFPGLLHPLPPEQLGEAFALWELTTAFLGFLLGVNPFDEPNVADAKARAREALQRAVAAPSATPAPELALRTHLAQVSPLHAVVFCTYLPETPPVAEAMDRLVASWQQALRTTVTWTFGPRYLHSTGQLHKGGPAWVIPVVLTAPNPVDLPIPGQPHTLGQLRWAQALGDVAALRAAGKAVLHLHLPAADPELLASLVPV
ncbi:MAG: transketolase [Thermoanaerobaculum sp.]|nr:transketolase [Thermoanaerobaculum sp.]